MTNITHHIMTLISFFSEKHKFYDIHQGDLMNQTEVSPSNTHKVTTQGSKFLFFVVPGLLWLSLFNTSNVQRNGSNRTIQTQTSRNDFKYESIQFNRYAPENDPRWLSKRWRPEFTNSCSVRMVIIKRTDLFCFGKDGLKIDWIVILGVHFKKMFDSILKPLKGTILKRKHGCKMLLTKKYPLNIGFIIMQHIIYRVIHLSKINLPSCIMRNRQNHQKEHFRYE